MHEFIKKHESKIIGTLSGWDRIRFRGTLQMLCAVRGLTAWLMDRQVLFREFKQFSLDMTAQLEASVEQAAAAAGRSIKYLASCALSKEDLVQELLRRENVSEGIVCLLSCVEPCRTFRITRDHEKNRVDFFPSLGKCLHWYVYFMDSLFGLCHVRIQSWLPFTVHICINGREWLCRELAGVGIGFHRRDNCLADVADFTTAQRMLTAQSRTPWTQRLNGLLQRACPALSQIPFRGGHMHYYWSAAETEWATDILFRSPENLADLYPPLLRHAMTTFSSPDVLRFLGRRNPSVCGWFRGEVVSDLKTRPEGVRIKHRLNTNSLKMYNKQGSVLRVETTINDPHDMKVFRPSEDDPTGDKSWRVLRKGVVDMSRRAEVSQAANSRYLTALGALNDQTPLGKVADLVSRPVLHDGRRARGLNPLTGEDARIAEVLLRGEFSINGFRNRDVRQLLFAGQDTARDQRRLSGKVTRLLRLFRAHELIRKVKGTHRYQLTSKGRKTLPAFLAARHASVEKLTTTAA